MQKSREEHKAHKKAVRLPLAMRHAAGGAFTSSVMSRRRWWQSKIREIYSLALPGRLQYGRLLHARLGPNYLLLLISRIFHFTHTRA
jgi:hypothetical protein